MVRIVLLTFIILSSCQSKSEKIDLKNFDIIISNGFDKFYDSKKSIYVSLDENDYDTINYKLTNKDKNEISQYLIKNNFFELDTIFQLKKSDNVLISSSPPYIYSIDIETNDQKIRKKISISIHQLNNINLLKNKKDARNFFDLFCEIDDLVKDRVQRKHE